MLRIPIILTILVLVLVATFYTKLINNDDKTPVVYDENIIHEGAIDITNKFKLEPLDIYYIRNDLSIGQQNPLSDDNPITVGRPLDKFELSIRYNNQFEKTLFRTSQCEYDGYLEKKVGQRWEIVNFQKCPGEGPIAPIERGNGIFTHYLLLEEVNPQLNRTKSIDITGTYRLRVDFHYGCKDNGNKIDNYSIVFEDCEGVAQVYSPEFKIEH
jgi:hypothetical protein